MPSSNPLTTIREAAGISQANLAELLDISEAVVSRIENGKAAIGVKTATRLWTHFGPQLRGRGWSFPALLAWRPAGAGPQPSGDAA